MMNPIGIRAEDRIGSQGPWFEDRRATPVPEHGGADPGGSTVRGSRWPGWRRATGRSCGRRAPPGSAWRRPSTTTRSPPPATSAFAVASAGPPDPGSAAPPPAASGRTSPLHPWVNYPRVRASRPRRTGGGPGRCLGGVRDPALPAMAAASRRRGRACTSCPSRRGRAGCDRPSCRPGVGAGMRRRAPRLR